MKLGIIGYGKMGSDIFSTLFFSKTAYDITVYCRRNAQEHGAKIEKELDKRVRRKRMTEEERSRKSASYRFTDTWEDFGSCDVMLESITEELEAKRAVFSALASIVSEKCLLLTNTSSLCIGDIFAGMPHRERCFGLHFFYPVKLSGFAEVNLLPQTDPKNAEIARSLAESMGKQALFLPEKYHLYLNRYLSLAIAQGIVMWKECGCTIATCEDVWKELFPIGGLFGILDSVGLGLMGASQSNMMSDRSRLLLEQSEMTMQGWLKSGCPAQSGAFLAFMAENEEDKGAKIPDKTEMHTRMMAVLLNEALIAAEEIGGEREILWAALADVTGLGEPLPYYIRQYGITAWKAALDENRVYLDCPVYVPVADVLWEKMGDEA